MRDSACADKGLGHDTNEIPFELDRRQD